MRHITAALLGIGVCIGATAVHGNYRRIVDLVEVAS